MIEEENENKKRKKSRERWLMRRENFATGVFLFKSGCCVVKEVLLFNGSWELKCCWPQVGS